MNKCTVLTLACTTVLLACGPDNQTETTSTRNQATSTGAVVNERIVEDLGLLAETKIYFGHQSVGGNLIDGIADLAAQAEFAGLEIVESNVIDENRDGGFFHSRVGENTRPGTKVDAFLASIDGMEASQPELALLKFCYVDFGVDTDVDDLTSKYSAAVDSLKSSHPEVKLVHVTAPLQTALFGIKERIYRMIGKEVWGDAANAKRNQYNEWLRQTYSGEPMFDLALSESTRQDGTRVTFRHDNQTYYALEPSYTYDGGHLNELGRRVAAAELIRVLADARRESAEESTR